MGIINRDGALWMATGVDNSGLYSGLRDSENRVNQFESHVRRVGDNITRLTGIGFGIAGVKAFGQELVNVTGEMQMLESSFDVLLGGKGVSGFMSEMKQFAVDSPLSMNGVANAAQTLLGFGITAEKVMPTIKQIGDISMGNEERFRSLSLAFAQMSATGKLMGQDLLQMINAGFNPLQIISEKTGKSIGDLKKEMESGSISSQMVADAFSSATAEGGKFYGMTQKQAEGIKGLQAQLDGGLQDALNNIGKSQEGVIAGGYKVAISLVENYETVGKILLSLVATYGTYRAALIVINALEKANVTIMRQAVLEKKLAAAANIKLTSAEAYQIASKKLLTLHTANVTKALKAQALAMATNPALLFTAAIVGLGWSIYKLATYESSLAKTHKEVAQFQAKVTTETRKETEALDKLFDSLKKTNAGTDERKKIVNELNHKYGDYLKGLELEKASLKELEAIQKKANNELDKSIRLRLLSQQTDETKSKYNKNIEEKYKGFVAQVTKMYDTDIGARIGVRLEERIKESIKSGVLFDEKKFLSEISEEFDKGEMDKGFITKNYNSLHSYLWTINRQIDDMGKELSLTEIAAKATIDELNKLNGSSEDDFAFIGKSQQIDRAREEVKRLKQEVDDLNKGIKPKDLPENTQFDFAEGIKEKTKELKEAEDKLNILLYGKSASDLNKGESAAEKARKEAQAIADQNERINQLLDKQSIDRKRAKEDLANQAEQAEINALRDGAEKIRRQRELDNALELQALERQKEDYITAYIQAQRELFNIQEELAVKKGEKKEKDVFKTDSINPDTSIFDKIIENVNKKHANYPKELAIQEAKDWNDYLIEFGNYQQKRKAIIDKYDREIEEAKTKGQKATFEKEKLNALDDLDSSIKGSTNLMAQLFADTSQKSVNEIQKIIDKIELLLKYLEAAKDENGNAIINGETISRQNILDLGISDNTLDNLENSTQEVEALKNGLKSLKGDLGSKSPFKQLESQIKDAVGAIKNGNLGVGISGIGNATSRVIPQIKEFGQNIANMFGDDELVDDIGHATDALSGLGDTAAGIGQIMSGDIAGGVMSAVSGITSMVSAFDGLFGSSDELTQATIDTYNRYMSTVDKLIAKQKELLESVSGADAVILANQAREAIQRQIDATRGITSDWLSSKSGGKYSGGNWRGADKVLSNYKKELEALGYNISSAQYDLITLSPEKLEEIRDKLPKMWADFDADLSGWLNTIIDLGEAMEDVSKAEKERLTGLSFDTLKDSLDDLLQSADTTFEDIGNSFEGHMEKSVLNFIKNKYLTTALKEWYEQFAEAYDDDILSKSEVDLLRGMYEEAYNKAQGLYDSALDTIGIDKDGGDSRSSQAKGFATASQDSIDYLNGMFTISVEHSRGILEFVGSINEQLKSMNIERKGIIDACTSILNYTRHIDQNTQELYGIREDIQSMRGDINNLVRHGITLKK